MKKIELKKFFTSKKVVGYLGAGVAAFVAFTSNLESQKKEKEFNEMKERLNKLENK